VYADQWDLIPILDAYFSKGDWLSQIFSHHGDHFHTSAYLIMLPLAKFSNWDLFWELVALLLINAISFLKAFFQPP
jgi:hypothetical protein